MSDETLTSEDLREVLGVLLTLKRWRDERAKDAQRAQSQDVPFVHQEVGPYVN